MARGGYVSSRVAITRLAQTIGERAKATRLISEAIISEWFAVRGRRQIVVTQPKRMPPKTSIVLRDILDAAEPVSLAPREVIPMGFWHGQSPSQVDLERGVASNPSWGSDGTTYEELSLAEKGLNRLIDLHRPRDLAADEKPERRRRARWNEWVAALTSVAIQPGFNPPHTTVTDLLTLLELKLDGWNLDLPRRPESSVRPILQTVLELLTKHPPRP